MVGRQPSLLLHDLPGRSVQGSCSTVVAESAPCAEHIVDRCASQGLEGGKPMHESFEVRHDGSDACLLEHDFADPYGVGVARLGAPRQLSTVLFKPGQQFVAHGTQGIGMPVVRGQGSIHGGGSVQTSAAMSPEPCSISIRIRYSPVRGTQKAPDSLATAKGDERECA